MPLEWDVSNASKLFSSSVGYINVFKFADELPLPPVMVVNAQMPYEGVCHKLQQ